MKVTHVKTSMDADHRVRKGEHQYRLGCTRCGCVRWYPMSMVGMPHCLEGWFGFLLKRGASGTH
jgi:hypothetical protein